VRRGCIRRLVLPLSERDAADPFIRVSFPDGVSFAIRADTFNVDTRPTEQELTTYWLLIKASALGSVEAMGRA